MDGTVQSVDQASHRVTVETRWGRVVVFDSAPDDLMTGDAVSWSSYRPVGPTAVRVVMKNTVLDVVFEAHDVSLSRVDLRG